MKFTEPEHARKFVAYTPPQRMEGPDGEAITAGSQTFVTYLKGIKVADITEGGYHATKGKRTVDPSEIKTVRVVFDPESINLEHTIAANIAPADPAVEVLRNAMENDEAVNVAIESVRMHKHRDTKELISPLTPIHALMGATTPGGKADMGASGKTTSRVIAAVNGETTVDCRSDATQWASLSSNQAGNLPPEGFRLLTDKEDWTKVAVAVPLDGTPRPGQPAPAGAPVDINALADLIIDHLDKRMAVENGRYISSPKDDEIAEGRPYSVTTMHNWVNLGSYLNSKFRYIFEWAYGYLKELRQSSPDDAEVLALVDVVLDIADHAQVKAYGGGKKVDQKITSYTEACRWTQWTIANRFQYSPDPTDEWKSNVRDYVVDKMTGGGVRIARSVLNRETIEPEKPARQQAKRAQETTPAAGSAPAASNGSNERMDNLNRCLGAVNDNWNNVEMLRRVYKHAASLDLLNAPVAVHDGQVVFDRAGAKLGKVISDRGAELSKPAPTSTTPEEEPAQTTSEPTPAPEVETEPEAPVSEPVADDEPMDDDDFASALGASTDSGDWGERLEGVRSMDAAQALWNQAQGALNESVEFRGDTVKLSEAFATVQAALTEAQELMEEATAATSVSSLNGIRIRAKKADLLEYEVEDGTSDNPVKLVDAIVALRGKVNKDSK